MHGCAVTTVEGIGSTKTKLHAVQVRDKQYVLPFAKDFTPTDANEQTFTHHTRTHARTHAHTHTHTHTKKKIDYCFKLFSFCIGLCSIGKLGSKRGKCIYFGLGEENIKNLHFVKVVALFMLLVNKVLYNSFGAVLSTLFLKSAMGTNWLVILFY